SSNQFYSDPQHDRCESREDLRKTKCSDANESPRDQEILPFLSPEDRETPLLSRPKGFRIFLEKILYLVSKHQTPQVIQRLQASKINMCSSKNFVLNGLRHQILCPSWCNLIEYFFNHERQSVSGRQRRKPCCGRPFFDRGRTSQEHSRQQRCTHC